MTTQPPQSEFAFTVGQLWESGDITADDALAILQQDRIRARARIRMAHRVERHIDYNRDLLRARPLSGPIVRAKRGTFQQIVLDVVWDLHESGMEWVTVADVHQRIARHYNTVAVTLDRLADRDILICDRKGRAGPGAMRRYQARLARPAFHEAAIQANLAALCDSYGVDAVRSALERYIPEATT